MNRHYHNGFQRVFLNDLNDVEPQLQAYDPYLYLMWSPSTGEHLIMDGLVELAVMKIPQIGFKNLNSSIVDHIKKIHTLNGFVASKEVDIAEDAVQKEMARQQEDLSYNLAKDTQKHVRQLA